MQKKSSSIENTIKMEKHYKCSEFRDTEIKCTLCREWDKKIQ